MSSSVVDYPTICCVIDPGKVRDKVAKTLGEAKTFVAESR